MNILEKYITDHNKFVVLIMGIPGTSKTIFAKKLLRNLNECLTEDHKIKLIRLKDYLIKGKYTVIEVENVKFNIYDSPENIDWNKLNEDVKKDKRVIIVGNQIDATKINFEYNLAYYFDTSYMNYKNYIIDKQIIKDVDEKTMDIYVYKVFKLNAEKLKKTAHFKIFNIKKDVKYLDVYDKVVESIINYISKKLYK
jgi:KaiC/GvpD/RAD55 family RecA-like ATPase